jgi:hypothetical protein
LLFPSSIALYESKQVLGIVGQRMGVPKWEIDVTIAPAQPEILCDPGHVVLSRIEDVRHGMRRNHLGLIGKDIEYPLRSFQPLLVRATQLLPQ